MVVEQLEGRSGETHRGPGVAARGGVHRAGGRRGELDEDIEQLVDPEVQCRGGEQHR